VGDPTPQFGPSPSVGRTGLVWDVAARTGRLPTHRARADPTRSSVSPRPRWLPGPPQGESRIFVDKCLYLSVTMATSAELAGHGAFLQATWGRQASLSTYLLIAQSIYCPQQLGYGPILLLRPLGSCGSCGTHVPPRTSPFPHVSLRDLGTIRWLAGSSTAGESGHVPGFLSRPSDAGLAPLCHHFDSGPAAASVTRAPGSVVRFNDSP
jgi:hypothetical protein